MEKTMSYEEFESQFAEELTAEYHDLAEHISSTYSIYSLEEYLTSEYEVYLAFQEMKAEHDSKMSLYTDEDYEICDSDLPF